MPHQLPSEVVSLIHHVELNRAGWWEKIVQRLIIASIWLAGRNMTAKEVQNELKGFGVNLDEAKLREQIESLCSAQTVMCLPDSRLKISEQSLKEFEDNLKENERIEKEAKDRFIVCLKSCCPTLQIEETWIAFNEMLLFPLIEEAGARVYELLSGQSVGLGAWSTFQGFLNQYPAEIQQPLRNAIISFWDPRQLCVRSYILRHLSTHFALEVINLSEDVIKAMARTESHPPSFIIYVDTNFIFSILGIHDNPSDEAASSFIDFIRSSSTVKVELYVLSPTLEEARRVLNAKKFDLKNLNFTDNLSRAALDSELGGIARKVAQEYLAGRITSIEDHFNFYLDNLVRLLESKGVKCADDQLVDYRTKQEVIDDVVQLTDQQKTMPPARQRSYEAILHDMMLWHFIKDRRPPQVESPVDAGFWMVTIDFRFLAFDRRKRSQHLRVPLCLHPTTFAQMMQFWTPRTPELEEVMLGVLRLPLLSQESDPDTEKAILRILTTLSRFENIHSIPQDTLTRILIDDALRHKVVESEKADEQIQFVREALIEENAKASSKLDQANKEIENLKGEVRSRTETVDQLSGRISILETQAEEKKQKEVRSVSIRSFVKKSVLIPVMSILVIGFLLAWVALRVSALDLWATFGAATVFLLIPTIYYVVSQGGKTEHVKDWKPFSTLKRFKKWACLALGITSISIALLEVGYSVGLGLLGAFILGITGNAVYDWLKRKP